MAAADGRSRRWIGVVLAACLAIFAYNLVADRLTPYSSHATVQAYLIGVAPEVAGKVVEVGVLDNQVVHFRLAELERGRSVARSDTLRPGM